MSEVLRACNLDVGYGKTPVVSDLCLDVLRGQTVCLIGPNGAGKSTILRTLAGMLAPVGGTVYIGKNDLCRMKPTELARQMAVVLTEKLNVGISTAEQIVAMGRSPYNGFFGRLDEYDREIIRNSMRMVGAESLEHRIYASLSDGEKQKVLIARALAQEPSLIILDEPTSHLDIKHKIEIMRILNHLSVKNGLTVILALHDVDIAVKSCQFVLLVKDGRIVAQGRPEDIIKADTIENLYEIEGAGYNATLGSIEIVNSHAPTTFVAAGGGTGAAFYRLLSRMGYGISTGVLQRNDVDFAVARSMRLVIAEEECFEPISQTAADTAARYLKDSLFAVDTGFHVGTLNRENIVLLQQAALSGKRVFALRNEDEVKQLYGCATSVIPVDSAAALQERISTI